MNDVYIPKPGKKSSELGYFVGIDKIMAIVQEYFGISREELIGKSQKFDVVYPRHVCVWLLINYSPLTLSGAGVLFGKKDHTAAYNSVKAINNYLSYDTKVKEQIELLKEKILA